MEKVMNNNDLRNIIFSYFRNKEFKICQKCKIVCKWSKNNYNTKCIEWNNFINCYYCFAEGFLKNVNTK
jgi:hypothetical protein